MENFCNGGRVIINNNWNVYRLNRTKLEGSIINERFVVGQQIGQGSYGKVYEVKDIYNIDEPLVIKFSSEFQTLLQEVSISQELTKQIRQSEKRQNKLKFQIPQIIHYGNVVLLSPEQNDAFM